MIKKETFAVLTEIKSYWDHFDVSQERIDKWHKILKDYEFDEIMANLGEYIKNNRFAPTIADLLKSVEKRDRAIPTHEETEAMIASWKIEQKNKASKETVDAALAEMRKILGIKRGV